MTKHIALFGDSILKGVILGEDKRYHISKEIDWQDIEQKLNITIDNCSKMGLCIDGGKEKLIKYLETNPQIDSIVLEYGGNDSDYKWNEVSQNPNGQNLPKTDLNQFANDLKNMIELIRSHNIKPILMTLPPIIAERYFDFIISQGNNKDNIKKFLGDVQIIYRRQELYSNEILKVAKQLDVDVVDVRSKFLQAYDLNSLYCQDGIHPNTNGQQLIVSAFLDFFRKNEIMKNRSKYESANNCGQHHRLITTAIR